MPGPAARVERPPGNRSGTHLRPEPLLHLADMRGRRRAGRLRIVRGEGAVDRGVHCSNTPVPPPVNPLAACQNGGIDAPTGGTDIDGQVRPQLRPLRTRAPGGLGADERPAPGAGGAAGARRGAGG